MSEPKQATPNADPQDEAFKNAVRGLDPATGNPREGLLGWSRLPVSAEPVSTAPGEVTPTPTPEERPAEEAPPAPQAEPEKPSDGGESQEGEDPVEKVLAKYRTEEEKAKAILSMRKWQSATAEERNKLDETLSKVSEFFDWDQEGNPILKASAAAQRLAAERKSAPEPEMPQQINEQKVRQEIEAEYANLFKDKIDPDDMPRFIDASKPHIDKLVAAKMEVAKQQAVAERTKIYVDAATASDQFFSQNPKYQDVFDEINEVFEEFPKPMRWWLISKRPNFLKRVAEGAYMAKHARNIAREAFEEGVKAGKAAGTPATTSPRRGGESVPRSDSGDGTADFKQAVLGRTGKKTLDSLFGR